MQSAAAQDKKNKEEKEQKNGMADKTEQSSNLHSSPRHPPVKRSSYSPSSVSSVDTQEEGHNSNLVGPPKISKKLETDFEAAMDDIVQEKRTGLDTTGAYTPNNVNSDNKTGRSIVADAKFVTDLVGMDFSKESTNRNKLVLFQKVIDHMKR